MLTASINLDVPALPDNDVAFANNAAWQNYWSHIDITATFEGADNAIYVEQAYDNNAEGHVLQYEGVEYNVASKAQFDSLLLAYQTLNTNYKNLREALKNAGIITEAQ